MDNPWFKPVMILLVGLFIIELSIQTGILNVANGPYSEWDIPEDGYRIMSEWPQFHPELGALVSDVEDMGFGNEAWRDGRVLVSNAGGILGFLDLRSGTIVWVSEAEGGPPSEREWFNPYESRLQAIGYDHINDVIYLGVDGAQREIWRLPGDPEFWTLDVLLEKDGLGQYKNRLMPSGHAELVPGGPQYCSEALWGIDVGYPYAPGDEHPWWSTLAWVCIGNAGSGPKYYFFRADAECAASVIPTDSGGNGFTDCVEAVDGWPTALNIDLPYDYDPDDARYSTKGWGGFNYDWSHEWGAWNNEWVLRTFNPDATGDRAQTEGLIVRINWEGNSVEHIFADQPALHESGLTPIYVDDESLNQEVWISIDNGYINPWGYGDSAPGVVDACRVDGSPNVAACDYINPMGGPNDIESAYGGAGGTGVHEEDSHSRLLFSSDNPGFAQDFPCYDCGVDARNIPWGWDNLYGTRLDSWKMMWPLWDISPPDMGNAGWIDNEGVTHSCDFEDAWCDWENPEEGCGCSSGEGAFLYDYGWAWMLHVNSDVPITPWVELAHSWWPGDPDAINGDCVYQYAPDGETTGAFWDAMTPWMITDDSLPSPSPYKGVYHNMSESVSGRACIAVVCNDEMQDPRHYKEQFSGQSWVWRQTGNYPFLGWMALGGPFYFNINGGCNELPPPSLPTSGYGSSGRTQQLEPPENVTVEIPPEAPPTLALLPAGEFNFGDFLSNLWERIWTFIWTAR